MVVNALPEDDTAARVPDGERFPCLTFLFIDPLGRDPLIRSFERHLYAENRSSRTVGSASPSRRRTEPSPTGRPGSRDQAVCWKRWRSDSPALSLIVLVSCV